MKVFLSGPITGVPDYRESFGYAEEQLTKRGHVVLNPAMLPAGLEHHQYMAICYPMLMAADVVVQLENWGFSKGALMECKWAASAGKPCRRLWEVLTGEGEA